MAGKRYGLALAVLPGFTQQAAGARRHDLALQDGRCRRVGRGAQQFEGGGLLAGGHHLGHGLGAACVVVLVPLCGDAFAAADRAGLVLVVGLHQGDGQRCRFGQLYVRQGQDVAVGKGFEAFEGQHGVGQQGAVLVTLVQSVAEQGQYRGLAGTVGQQ
ncbi:hypothetical protein D3C79_895240 [compost metagenome]